MDLLEYQGKQLFARHGLEVSSGRAVATSKGPWPRGPRSATPSSPGAQVLIGGRGKAGGVKPRRGRAAAREHAGNILGMNIRGHTVHTLWIEHASDIAAEIRGGATRPLGEGRWSCSAPKGRRHRRGRGRDPERLVRRHVDVLSGLSREQAPRSHARAARRGRREQVADALVAP
jgi:succinyl-CoA synthetase beta subunit